MTRCAIHIKMIAPDLDRQVRFYTGVFGKKPAQLNCQGATWITDNPRIRFEVSADSAAPHQFLWSGPV